ncbi:MAG: myristoyl transferase [Thermobacillus sp. ZCTH02-B1]|uniref:ABC transporter substrate-binding protein n=1 Tax=Thermobacillus sp. ZCTH02-B1 TaxID=1858795 RepID=UPI000B55D741|nr:ABC transporter substrate-binding protein [Thermobacillus sp. ZCTH02-B1]OUM94406.1 MAG: myristoyl transferase [Thermobacillus sp. ZCTH02-B1]
MERAKERGARGERIGSAFIRQTAAFLCLIGIVALASACGGNGGRPTPTPAPADTGTASGGEKKETEAADTEGESAGQRELVKVTQVTNWFAEPEHGGQYAALMKGFYEEAGLDMTILPGGPQVSATQIVGSGNAEFGMTQADSLLLAREQGIPIVAIAATFQKNPQGLIYHADQDIRDFPDLNGRTVFVAPGAAYWEYLKKKYDLKVEERSYTGSLAGFISDPASVTQGYITSEPFSLKQQGIETGMLLHADAGYDPYANVLFTTERMIRERPDLVRAFIEASVKGWDYYKDHYEEIHPFLREYNPDLTLEAMEYGAKAQMDLVYGGDAAEGGVGIMTEERWRTLADQMLEIGMLKEDPDVTKAFTNEFLPAR